MLRSITWNTIDSCFNPRHGIHATNAGEVRAYHFCFQCSHLCVYPGIDSDEYERIGLEGDVTPSVLNKILDEAKIHRETPECVQ